MYVIGTAGHVDHGKSRLVEALTGIDPDRLREEKTRGMTIDLGFAWLTLPSGREVSIVDVPGHERFIKNMLAGAGGIDVALLVVAADDGVMPQTREHLAILDLLDVRRGVVALTKRDLVNEEWLSLVAADIEKTLADTTLAGVPVIACSSLTGAGLVELTTALDAAIDELPPKRDIGRPRLPIDRVFTIGGFGTVVTGTLIDGSLRVGDEIEVMPGGMRGRVRGLQSHRAAVERALPGTRTAVNVTGLAKDSLRRGMVVAAPNHLRATTVLDARVRGVAGMPRALKHNVRLSFHAGADDANALMRLVVVDELRAGESAWAQIKLDTAVSVVRGDRFVLRTPEDTVAGGIVADTAPKRHRRHDAGVAAALEAMLRDAPEDLVREAIARRPLLTRGMLDDAVPLSPDAITAAIDALVEVGVVRAFHADEGVRYALAEHADALAAEARSALTTYHAEHHLRPGMPRQELRTRLGIAPDAFATVTASWDGIRVFEGVAALAEFVARPAAGERTAVDAYLASLPDGGGEPLVPALMSWLAQSGAIVDAGSGVVFEAQAFDAMTSAVRAYITEHGSITIADARDLFGTNRKRAQALLEELDRRHVTRRKGDAHVLW
jgi:selenocysteine-specific elongation factor